MEGAADLLSLPDAMEPLVDHYRRAAGEHGDWEDSRRTMEQEQRLLIRLTATRVGPDRSG